MKAAYLSSPGSIVIRDVSLPEPGPGEIVIKIRSALTCGTDLKAYLRGHDLIPMPGPFGHEFSGTVHTTGNGVATFKEGDEIMSVHSAPCQMCSYCNRGAYNLCMNIMKEKVLGAFSEYLLIPEHVVRQNTFKKPDTLSFDEAAMLEPLSCVIHPYGSRSLEDVRTALIIGAGPIGLLHLLYLRNNGIHTIVSDINPERIEAANRLGSNEAVMHDQLIETVNGTTDGMGVDLVVECTGRVDIWNECINHVRRGGSIILFGGCKKGTSVQFDTYRLHYDEISLSGSFHFIPQDVESAYELLCSEHFDVKPLISKVVGLDEIGEVFEHLRNGKGIKYAIRP